MLTWPEIFPPFGLRITCGPVDLRTLSHDDIPALMELAQQGVHNDGRPMPFITDWSGLPKDDIPLNSTRFYWQTWASFSADDWTLLMVTRRDGVVVGSQDLRAKAFPLVRTAKTGSWLGLSHQGLGTGTLMRQAICALAFDHLGAVEMRTEAYSDNARSRRVSEKVGYREVDRHRANRQGDLASEVQYVLTPDAFVRPPYPVEVSGLGPFREFIGL